MWMMWRGQLDWSGGGARDVHLWCARRSRRLSLAWQQARRLRRSTALVCVLTTAGLLELWTGWLQSQLLTAVGQRLRYVVEDGVSMSIRYPTHGPYDRRLGYVTQPTFVERLSSQGYDVQAQARWSTALVRFAERGFFPAYREKTRAGLAVLDRHGRSLYTTRHPARTYDRFHAIPRVIVQSLLFVESRELLAPPTPFRNPAIEYDRLTRAVLDFGVSRLGVARPVTGGSTLAVQMEKFRHSPRGRTGSVAEKWRQLVSASVRSYLDGEKTLQARERLVTAYLNTVPLAAVAGYGEVFGLGDGLATWFDADLDRVTTLLSGDRFEVDDPLLTERAMAYRQALSLLLAAKRPTSYLVDDPAALGARVDAYLRVLHDARIIPRALRDRALAVRVTPRRRVASKPRASFVERKLSEAARTAIMARLDVSSAYDLDRLDLTVRTTVDGAINEEITRELGRLADRAYVREIGLATYPLLGSDDPAPVVYGFTLYERTAAGNVLRLQSDNYDGALNINQDTRLELGSTAKLRTLITYLEVVEKLYEHYRRTGSRTAVSRSAPDPLSRWAATYLAQRADPTLAAMLDAAMERRYSARPAAFFTGGGLHHFHNFDADDNGRTLTVREAFHRSVNLVFVRLIRDIVNYYIFQSPYAADALAQDNHPMRQAYLSRFADYEGREYLERFYRTQRRESPQRVFDRLATQRSSSASRLTMLFRAVRPSTDRSALEAFLRHYPAGRGLSPARVQALYAQYDPARWSSNDRGYLARAHPLELWLLRYLFAHPEADLAEVQQQSARARQEAADWLFKTSNKRAQDRRIRTILEMDAFAEIHVSWQRLRYPFKTLVPSYATALGSSGDSPRALSDLLGIVLGNGIRARTIMIDEWRFGADTAYDTTLTLAPVPGTRVLSPDIAALVRRDMIRVVERGSGRRAAGGVQLADGRILDVGGKTGTGDNRFRTEAGDRIVNRTATFAFVIGDRFFGAVTAHVPGPAAHAYDFTSALPVQLFKHLLPKIRPLLEEAGDSSREPAAGSA